jgi:hypothetical protein
MHARQMLVEIGRVERPEVAALAAARIEEPQILARLDDPGPAHHRRDDVAADRFEGEGLFPVEIDCKGHYIFSVENRFSHYR